MASIRSIRHYASTPSMGSSQGDRPDTPDLKKPAANLPPVPPVPPIPERFRTRSYASASTSIRHSPANGPELKSSLETGNTTTITSPASAVESDSDDEEMKKEKRSKVSSVFLSSATLEAVEAAEAAAEAAAAAAAALRVGRSSGDGEAGGEQATDRELASGQPAPRQATQVEGGSRTLINGLDENEVVNARITSKNIYAGVVSPKHSPKTDDTWQFKWPKLKRFRSASNLKSAKEAADDQPPQIPELSFQDRKIDKTQFTHLKPSQNSLTLPLPRQRSRTTTGEPRPLNISGRAVTAPPDADTGGKPNALRYVPEKEQRRAHPPYMDGIDDYIQQDGPRQPPQPGQTFNYVEINTGDRLGEHFLRHNNFTYPERGGVEQKKSAQQSTSLGVGTSKAVGQSTHGRAQIESVIMPTPEMSNYLSASHRTDGPPSPTGSETMVDEDYESHYSDETVVARPDKAEEDESLKATIGLRRDGSRKAKLNEISQKAATRKERQLSQPSDTERPDLYAHRKEHDATMPIAHLQPPKARLPTVHTSPNPFTDRADSGVLMSSSPLSPVPSTPSSGRSVHPAFRDNPLEAFHGPTRGIIPTRSALQESPISTPTHHPNRLPPRKSSLQHASPALDCFDKMPSKKRPGYMMSPTQAQWDSALNVWVQAMTGSPSQPAELEGHSILPTPSCAAAVELEATPITKRPAIPTRPAPTTPVPPIPPKSAARVPSTPKTPRVPEVGFNEDYQDLRRSLGQPLLRPRPDMGQKHPNHPFDWKTCTLMCKNKHPNPESQKSPAKGPLNITTCAECGDFCCYFAELVSNKKQFSRDLAVAEATKTSTFRLGQLLGAAPDGVEPFDVLLKCVVCKKIVCPTCGELCGQEGCVLPVCEECSVGAKAPHNHKHAYKR